MRFLEVCIVFYFGGMMNQLLGMLVCRSDKRVGIYGVVFACVYWIPLGIEYLLDKRPPPH
jgi:hypothetical protein